MRTISKSISTLTNCHTIMQTCLLLLSLIVLQSCIMTTVVKDIEKTVTSAPEHYTTKGENLNEGLLTLQIQNNAENTMLQIDSLGICNIQLMDSTGKDTCYGSLIRTGSVTIIDTLLQLYYGANTIAIYNLATQKIKIPTQKLTPWNPTEHPARSKNTYAKIHGTLNSYLPNNETYPIYSGTMYYPLSGNIPAATSDITNPQAPASTVITIHPNCPLYAIINSSPQKVLQPISFTVTVEDWE